MIQKQLIKRPGASSLSPGFTLLEITLAMAILSVVAFYSLDMYQGLSSQKKQVDDRSKMKEIALACNAYYSGHETLPPGRLMGSYFNVLPVADLGLAQRFRLDTHGYPYVYLFSGTASGFQVDGRSAAGVIISFGENQRQDYTVAGTNYTTLGDDILVPVEVSVEAVSIALTELEALGKRVEGYNREFAGIQNDGANYYGDTAAGAPPIVDPDEYDGQFAAFPQLYPMNSPPTDEDLVYGRPDRNWPAPPIYNNWPNRPPNPPVGLDLPPNFAGWSAPGPGFPAWPFGTNVFGEYAGPSAPQSYQLIDEGGCRPAGGAAPADPNCGLVNLDAHANPVLFIRMRYGLGSSFQTDPWGNQYRWGASPLPRNDPRYHLFYSSGPDGTPGTSDDVFLF